MALKTKTPEQLASTSQSASVDPSTPSSDYAAMLPYWEKVSAMLGGTEEMRKAGEKYLPKFLNEAKSDYDYRLANSKFTNIFRDIADNLSSKPFSKELTLTDESSSEQLRELVEDIDGRGNDLHVFSSDVFFQGIVDAVDWIFVDKAPVPDNATVKDERELGARPYWVHVSSRDMIAAYSDMVEGREQFVHVRMLEYEVVRDGFKEREVMRVRELDRPKLDDGSYGPAVWRVWEKVTDEKTKKKRWMIIDEGKVSIGVIAVVPFVTGRRKGTSWQFHPLMKDAAELQIKHYQYETNLDCIKEVACFPMLSAEGVEPPESGSLVVGPRKVLFAPPNASGTGSGRWSYIQPSSDTMRFLAEDIKNVEQQLRELGRQPLTANSGNLTTVTTAFAAQKGNSAIQASAMNLKDALEQALRYTCMWLNDESSDPVVSIYTDFDVETGDDKGPEFILRLREKGDISRATVLNEAKRRSFLSADFDAEQDAEQIELEKEGKDHTEEDIRNALLGFQQPGQAQPNDDDQPPPPPPGEPEEES